MKNILYVPQMKKNIPSISALDENGMRVAFVDGQVLLWHKGKRINDATVVGEQERGLYRLKGQLEQALVHESIETSELWNQRLAHVHYRTLLIA